MSPKQGMMAHTWPAITVVWESWGRRIVTNVSSKPALDYRARHSTEKKKNTFIIWISQPRGLHLRDLPHMWIKTKQRINKFLDYRGCPPSGNLALSHAGNLACLHNWWLMFAGPFPKGRNVEGKGKEGCLEFRPTLSVWTLNSSWPVFWRHMILG